MSNHVKQRDLKRGGSRSCKAARGRAIRPKTFSNEDSAKKWAEKKGVKSYLLKNLKSPESKTKKLKVVEVKEQSKKD